MFGVRLDEEPRRPDIWTMQLRFVAPAALLAFGTVPACTRVPPEEYRETAENGQMVVALIDGNYATVKKFYREPDFIRLEPANPQFKAIFIKTPGRLQLQGVVRGLIRNYPTPAQA